MVLELNDGCDIAALCHFLQNVIADRVQPSKVRSDGAVFAEHYRQIHTDSVLTLRWRELISVPVQRRIRYTYILQTICIRLRLNRCHPLEAALMGRCDGVRAEAGWEGEVSEESDEELSTSLKSMRMVCAVL